MSARVNTGALRQLRVRLLERRDDLLLAAGDVMGAAVAKGAVALQDRLEAATTETGFRRELLYGGFPGRHDTGDMVGSISYSDPNEPLEVEGEREVYAFGWFPGDFEPYFYEQDVGLNGIPAAGGMAAAVPVAQDYVRTHMPLAMGGR